MQSNSYERISDWLLASEGAIYKRDEIKSCQIDDSKGFAHVDLTHELGDRFEYSTKRMIASCCGKSREFYFQNDAAIAKRRCLI